MRHKYKIGASVMYSVGEDFLRFGVITHIFSFGYYWIMPDDPSDILEDLTHHNEIIWSALDES